MSNAYTDARGKLIPEAVRRTEREHSINIGNNTVPEPQAAAYLRHMDALCKENYLVSFKGMDVDRVKVYQALKVLGIDPTRAGRVIMHYGIGSIGRIDYESSL